jgi:BCD family chlorophyll transporter-like MFS transporter
MAVLALGGTGAALATSLAASDLPLGLTLAAASFLLVGAGAGAAGTSVLAMLASNVAPERRAAAATTVWVMMILGFAITAPIAGHFLEPFSQARLIEVTATVCAVAFALATAAALGVEPNAPDSGASVAAARKPPFSEAFGRVWREPAARRFTVFIFVSMLAYSTQELLVEPFAGLVFGMAPGATTRLAGVQHGGVLLGMLAVAFAASAIGGPILGSLRLWTVGGCLASAVSLLALALSGFGAEAAPLRACVFALGVSNGVFAVAAIGSMMSLAGAGMGSREGTRMGLWGAAQAVAFGAGGFAGTLAVGLARHFVATPLTAYAAVFVAEAALFVWAARLATRSAGGHRDRAAVGESAEARLAVRT